MRCLQLLLAGLIAFGAAADAAAQPREPIVRVLLLGRTTHERVTVRASEGPLTLYADRSAVPAATLQPGESATIARLGDRIRLTAPATDLQASIIEATSPNGPFELQTARQRRSYRGALSVERGSDGLRLVNYVPLAPYVTSVVASEYPFQEMEGVKAQAVLARTYALRKHDPSKPYDVTDNTSSQVYRGVEAETPIARAAVEQTRGEILRYDGALAEAAYYSCSGGHTASNDDVWNGNPVPYLRGRPDPYDADCPDHRWTTTASASGVLRALSRRFGGNVRGVEIAGRAPSGRVTRVRLVGTNETIGGNAFRATVNAAFGARTVRSTHFTLDRSGGSYRFTGRGFGHGVGMSQYGARGQARQGRSYRDILAFYFAGTYTDQLLDQYAAPIVPASRTTTAPPAAPGIVPTRSAGYENPTPARRTAW